MIKFDDVEVTFFNLMDQVVAFDLVPKGTPLKPNSIRLKNKADIDRYLGANQNMGLREFAEKMIENRKDSPEYRDKPLLDFPKTRGPIRFP